MTVNQSNDVWVVEAFEDIDFGAEVLLEFLVELGQVNGFDSDVGAMPLESSLLADVLFPPCTIKSQNKLHTECMP
jgi:hypothetical protein